jgi:hypothetical protein
MGDRHGVSFRAAAITPVPSSGTAAGPSPTAGGKAGSA